jgi:hypothetical protein
MSLQTLDRILPTHLSQELKSIRMVMFHRLGHIYEINSVVIKEDIVLAQVGMDQFASVVHPPHHF